MWGRTGGEQCGLWGLGEIPGWDWSVKHSIVSLLEDAGCLTSVLSGVSNVPEPQEQWMELHLPFIMGSLGIQRETPRHWAGFTLVFCAFGSCGYFSPFLAMVQALQREPMLGVGM